MTPDELHYYNRGYYAGTKRGRKELDSAREAHQRAVVRAVDQLIAEQDRANALAARVAELEAALTALRDGPGIECIPDNRVQDMIRALLSGKERT